MLGDSKAFSGIAVDDLEAARRFYVETLEQQVEVLDEVNPASYTVLNFPVDDVDAAAECSRC